MQLFMLSVPYVLALHRQKELNSSKSIFLYICTRTHRHWYQLSSVQWFCKFFKCPNKHNQLMHIESSKRLETMCAIFFFSIACYPITIFCYAMCVRYTFYFSRVNVHIYVFSFMSLFTTFYWTLTTKLPTANTVTKKTKITTKTIMSSFTIVFVIFFLDTFFVYFFFYFRLRASPKQNL